MYGTHKSNGHTLTIPLPASEPLAAPPRAWYAVKPLLDFIFALVLLVLSGPLILLLAGFVKLTSRGPALYRQTRVGRGGRPYTLYKLRTMTCDAERAGAQWARPGDPRITFFGAILRKTHLDELPQLWNVLRGEMSVVGPRPERPEFVPALAQAIPHYRDRLLVKPGVTGLAQVRQGADTDLESVRRKLAYDLYYVRHRGLWLDFRIILCTGLKVVGVPFRVLAALFWLPTRAPLDGTPSSEAGRAVLPMPARGQGFEAIRGPQPAAFPSAGLLTPGLALEAAESA